MSGRWILWYHPTICAFLAAKINGQVSPGSTYPARQKSVRDIMNVLRRKFTGAHFYIHVDPMCDSYLAITQAFSALLAMRSGQKTNAFYVQLSPVRIEYKGSDRTCFDRGRRRHLPHALIHSLGRLSPIYRGFGLRRRMWNLLLYLVTFVLWLSLTVWRHQWMKKFAFIHLVATG